LVGRRCVTATAVDPAAEVVDHDVRAVARQAERVLATDTATRAGDDRDSSLTQLGHDCDSFAMHSSDV
jgi:hypothetical protein